MRGTDLGSCLSPQSLLISLARCRFKSTTPHPFPLVCPAPGEGAAVLILEEEEHARARGAKVLAELRSVGLSSDAHHITSPPPDGDGALRAMQAALRLGNVRVS